MNFKLYLENLEDEIPLFKRKLSEPNTILVNSIKWKNLGLSIPSDLPLLHLEVPGKNTFIDVITGAAGLTFEFPDSRKMPVKMTSTFESSKASSATHARSARFASSKREKAYFGEKLLFGTAQDVIEGSILAISLDTLSSMFSTYFADPEAYQKHIAKEQLASPLDKSVIQNAAFEAVKLYSDITEIKTHNLGDFLAHAAVLFTNLLIPDGLSDQKITNIQDIKGVHVASRKEVIDSINRDFTRARSPRRFALEQFSQIKPVLEDTFRRLTRTTVNIYDIVGDKPASFIKLTGRENGKEKTRLLSVQSLKDKFFPGFDANWPEIEAAMKPTGEFEGQVNTAAKFFGPALFI